MIRKKEANKKTKGNAKKLKLNKKTMKDLESKGEEIKGGMAKGCSFWEGLRAETCCDRNIKENFAAVEMQEVLDRLSGIPIETWNYNWDDPTIRHISPMAQDFAAAFAVGEDNKHIHPIDVSGVAFASIQALYQMLKESRAEVQELQKEIRKLQGK